MKTWKRRRKSKFKPIFIRTTLLVLIGFFGGYYYLSSKINDKTMDAVILGPISSPGKIVKYIDRYHIYVSTNGDTIPESVVWSIDGNIAEDIEYQQQQGKLDSITVKTSTINGKGPYIVDYVYNFTPPEKKPIKYKLPFASTVAVARYEDKLYVIDSLINEKPRVEVARLTLVRESESKEAAKVLQDKYKVY
jgi:hypothetical protein